MLGHQIQSLLRCDKPPEQGLFFADALHQALDRRVRAIQHDVGLDLVHIGGLQHADGGANHVEVRYAMAHDDDAVALLHQIAQGMRDDAGADARPLLYGAGFAAIEGQPLTGLHGGLVSPAAERHIQAGLGEFAQLAEALGTKCEADAERNRHLQVRGHFADLVQDHEPALLQFVQRFLIQDHQISLGGQPPQVHAVLFGPFRDRRRYAGD
ncbi:hypothetical protein D3C74_300390 [compost metagenome]